jgi:hypothetical protein
VYSKIEVRVEAMSYRLIVICLSTTNISNAKRLQANILIFGYTQLVLLFLVLSNGPTIVSIYAFNCRKLYVSSILYLFQLTRHVWNGIIKRVLLTEVLIAMLVFHSGGNVYLKAVTAKLE